MLNKPLCGCKSFSILLRTAGRVAPFTHQWVDFNLKNLCLHSFVSILWTGVFLYWVVRALGSHSVWMLMDRALCRPTRPPTSTSCHWRLALFGRDKNWRKKKTKRKQKPCAVRLFFLVYVSVTFQLNPLTRQCHSPKAGAASDIKWQATSASVKSVVRHCSDAPKFPLQPKNRELPNSEYQWWEQLIMLNKHKLFIHCWLRI